MRQVSDAAAFGVGALVGVIALLVLGFVLSAGCTTRGPHTNVEKVRIDGSCFAVFTRGETNLAVAEYQCPAAREELIQEGGTL